MVTEVLGYSVEKRPIEAVRLTEGPVTLLLMGGVHGDEPEGYYLVGRYVKERLWSNLEGRASLWVIERANPDGCDKKTRGNGHGVDLNRNMPTRDWTSEVAKPRYNPGPSASSEPETVALTTFIEKIKPKAIVTAHSWQPMINYNGPARLMAEHMASFSKLRISDDIGYPTPGSMGTWAGWERKIPTITLEIQEDSTEPDIWSTHSKALAETLLFAATQRELG